MMANGNTANNGTWTIPLKSFIYVEETSDAVDWPRLCAHDIH